MNSESLEKVGFVIRPSSPLADAVCGGWIRCLAGFTTALIFGSSFISG